MPELPETAKRLKRGDPHPSGDGRRFWCGGRKGRRVIWLSEMAFRNSEECQNRYHRIGRELRPLRYLMKGSKNRAMRKGIPFSMVAADLSMPRKCPVLGIELNWGAKDRKGTRANWPSIDRIIPNLGYVSGNVRVISYRANTIRGNASPEELRLVLNDALKLGLQTVAVGITVAA